MYLLYINWKRAENDTTTVFADTAKTTDKYYNNIHGYRLGEEEERMLFFVYAKLNVIPIQHEIRKKLNGITIIVITIKICTYSDLHNYNNTIWNDYIANEILTFFRTSYRK